MFSPFLKTNIEDFTLPFGKKFEVVEYEATSNYKSDKRRVSHKFKCIILQNYTNHILVRVLGKRGTYDKCINKIDIFDHSICIKEVVNG